MAKKKIFVICPVRRPEVGFLNSILIAAGFFLGIEDEWTKNQNAIKKYVSWLEAEGCEVYWPARDNPYQITDNVGITICEHNRYMMFWADEVHIWYDKNSMGSIFDIGMFFAFSGTNNFKKFVIINHKDVKPTLRKSFENVILALAKKFYNPVADGLRERWKTHGK
ncbi:MAG: hypothetical protein HYV51_03525 [Parcubacteria group bacterium]|nr:hypothetical protein [Parcubacteria group bacterium]